MPLGRKLLRIGCGPPGVVLKPVSKTAQWARSLGFHVSSAQLTLEDFSCSVFFVEGRIILISTMQHLLLKNILSC